MANAFTGYTNFATNRGERGVRIIGEPEASLDHPSLARRQSRQGVTDLLGKETLFGSGLEVRRIVVGDDVRQARVLVLAYESVERNRLGQHLVQLAHPLGRQLQRDAHFFV